MGAAKKAQSHALPFRSGVRLGAECDKIVPE